MRNAVVKAQAANASVFHNITAIERQLLKLEQVECPVIHRFGPGIYIREVYLPAGALVVGHHHKCEHTNIMLKGKLTLLNDNDSTSECTAPFMYVAKPGRKIAYIHEDVVWQNIYATTETDIEALEDMFLVKSEAWRADKNLRDNVSKLKHCVDHADYEKFLIESGFSHEHVVFMSENEADQIHMPFGGYKVKVGDSGIQGRGLFATAQIQANEFIAPARIKGKRTFAGRFTNHALRPNAKMILLKNGDIDLIATQVIKSCYGGNDGEEITIDYRQAIILARRHQQENTLCLV